MKSINEKGLALEQKIEEIKFQRTQDENPQTLYHKFKEDVNKITRERAKIAISYTEKDIQQHEIQLKLTLNNESLDKDTKKNQLL